MGGRKLRRDSWHTMEKGRRTQTAPGRLCTPSGEWLTVLHSWWGVTNRSEGWADANCVGTTGTQWKWDG